MDFICFQKKNAHPCTCKTLTWKILYIKLTTLTLTLNYFFPEFCTSMVHHQKLCKNNWVCFHLALHWRQYLHQKLAIFCMVECKTKRWQNGQKHIPMLLWSLWDYESANLNKYRMPTWKPFRSLLITLSLQSVSHDIQRLFKTDLLLLDILSTCQKVLNENIRLLI